MSNLAGTGRLLRFALRRDRFRLAVWVAVLGLVPVITANALIELYPTEAAREQLAATVASTPALIAILGPLHGSTLGALTAWRIGTLGSVLMGLMAVLTMIRHTRDEEEAGRRELLGATVVGRHAPLAAALLVTGGAGSVVGLIVFGGLATLGLPMAGSLSFGLGFIGVAATFAGVGAVAAQLTETAASARGIGVTLIGVAFLSRLAGDTSEGSLGWMSWISPVGWFGRLRPFADERWWVLGLWAGLTLALVSIASLISARRDVGAGALPARPGPARAGRSLRSPFGLAWRLHRGALVGWTMGLATIGVVYGYAGDSIGEMLSDNPQLAEIFEMLGGEAGITDAFFGAAVGIFGLLSSAFAIRAVLRLRVEEEGRRAEPILATATPRERWVGSHLGFGVLGPGLLLLVAGLTMGLSYGAVSGDPTGQAFRVVGAAVAQLPAVWVLAGVAVALFGMAPRLTGLSWGVLVTCLLLGQLGQILQFPQWALNLSPFTHVSRIRAQSLGILPLGVLTALASLLTLAGLIGFRSRDLEPD